MTGQPDPANVPYEPPAIDERTKIDLPLVAEIVGSPPPPSAAFHPDADAYEPPAIDERTKIDLPLVAAGAGSPVGPGFVNEDTP